MILDGLNYDIAQLPLEPWGSTLLTSVQQNFNFETEGQYAKEFADELSKKMIKLGGVGLSANQIGIPRRVFVFGNPEKQLVLFNPYILGYSKEESVMEEGCLSLPGLYLVLRRPEKVVVNFFDVEGKEMTGTFEGIGARVVQHEMDHMEGKNFTMLASKMKLDMAVKRWKNKQRKEFQRMLREAQRQHFLKQNDTSTKQPEDPNSTTVDANA